MRRTWMLATIVVAAALAVGCGDDDSSDSGGGGSGEEATGSFTVVGWGGALGDAEREAWLEPFSEESGIEFREDGPPDPAKLKAQVDSGNVTWDVYSTEDFYAVANCGTLFGALDPKVVKKDAVKFFPDTDVTECGAPIELLSNVLVYDETKFGDDPPTTYADFFDTEKYPGKRGLTSFLPYHQLESALLADGVAPEELYPLDLDRAFAKLDTIKDDVVLWDTGAQMQEALEAGSVAMGIVWNGRAYDAAKNGAEIGAVWKDNLREGTMLTVVKGSKNKRAAEEYINFAMQPEQQARLTELIPYAPATEDSKPKIDALTRDWLPTTPANYEQGIVMDVQWWADNYDEAAQRWTDWTAG